MIYFFHHYELPAILQQAQIQHIIINSQQQRQRQEQQEPNNDEELVNNSNRRRDGDNDDSSGGGASNSQNSAMNGSSPSSSQSEVSSSQSTNTNENSSSNASSSTISDPDSSMSSLNTSRPLFTFKKYQYNFKMCIFDNFFYLNNSQTSLATSNERRLPLSSSWIAKRNETRDFLLKSTTHRFRNLLLTTSNSTP